MQKTMYRWTTVLFAVSLALTGCMKSGEDATGARSETAPALDESHGGARIALPDIDPSALAKLGPDSASPDTAATAWFELGITGDGMPSLFYKFPLAKGGQTFEIKGIPAGKQRSFHGSLRNANGVLTHDGITLADIKAGAFADVRLYLAKAGGTANVCVVIEGQKLPACAQDSLPPKLPPDSVPVPPKPDSGALGSIPMPGAGSTQATLCFEMRFDYGTTACERQGFAKMTFQAGKITQGNMVVADRPSPFYTGIMGQYDSANISFYGVTQDAGVTVQDTLDLKGRVSLDATMAKGDYLRLPSGKKGNWTMKVAPCGAAYPVYPDPSCPAKAK
jgi:hypothetical protein